jgi:L,D-transpeptidase YcbB
MSVRGLTISTFALLAAAAACNGTAAKTREEVQRLLQLPPSEADAAVWPEVQRFYTGREFAPAWTDGSGIARNTERVVAIGSAAEAHGLDPRRYGLRGPVAADEADETSDTDRVALRARFDVALTTTVMRLGHDVAVGALDPGVIDPRWNARRTPPDLASALDRAIEVSPSIATFLASVAPVHPEYAALTDALAALKKRAAQPWPTVPRGRFQPGQRSDAIVTLRRRLAASGELSATSVTSRLYDAELRDAVRDYQDHHGLRATGLVDEPTRASLNVAATQRVAQVAATLERWRWMPDDLGSRHVLVNIPSFHLVAREDGRPVLDIRVVVGKKGNETPIFSDEMTHVVFSPYWNIPDTIALAETVPIAARDPEYLTRNNMEVVNAAGRVVPESTIPWDDEGALKAFSFRQRPGANNALGHVKFMFPNTYNVYIHDTPADALFARIGRAFSHGCVRLEEPERFAQYVLSDQSAWTGDAIFTAMRAGEERHVKLSASIPVHIVYLTAWVDEQGRLQLRDDVYGYDKKQAGAAALKSRDSLRAGR